MIGKKSMNESKILSAERGADSVQRHCSAYRYEALCQVCWKQFELPCEDAEHVCSSPHCQRVKLMKRCEYCKTRTHHETNGIGMWICTVCACDDTPNDRTEL